MPRNEDDRTSAQPTVPYVEEIAVLSDPPQTAGIRLIREGPTARLARRGPTTMLAGMIIAGLATYGASMWSADTFGSRYADAAACLAGEYRAQRLRRAHLLRKRYEGTLTSAEAGELEMLQSAERLRLSAELGPSINHLRDLLRT